MARATVRLEVQFLLTVDVTEEQFEALRRGDPPAGSGRASRAGTAYDEAYEAACAAAERAYEDGEVGLADGMAVVDVLPYW